MTKYYRITEKELLELKSVTDTLYAMSGTVCEDFNAECDMGKKCMDSILKRVGFKRKVNEFQSPVSVENAYEYE